MDRKPLNEIKAFGDRHDDYMRVHIVVPAGANPLARPDDNNIRLSASNRTAEGEVQLGQMDYDANPGTIDSVYVRPEHRRQGLAPFGSFGILHPRTLHQPNLQC